MNPIRVLLLVVLAAVAAIFLKESIGEVLIRVPPWQLHISFSLALVITGLSFFFFYVLLRGLALFAGMPSAAAEYKQERERERNYRKLNEATRLLFEGRFGQAQKKAAAVYEVGQASDIAGMAALVAARAARGLRERELQQAWIDRARNVYGHKTTEAASLVLQAEMEIEEQDYRAAVRTLDAMQKKHGRHIATLKLEMRARRGIRDWEAMLRAVRQLQKRGGMPAHGALELKLIAHRGRLESIQTDPRAIVSYLAKLPTDERDPRLILSGVRYLLQRSATRESTQLLEEQIEQFTHPKGFKAAPFDSHKDWLSQLFRLYGEIKDGHPAQRLAHAENWLERYPNNPALLLTAGKLCCLQQQWAKAQQHLTAALEQSSSPRETASIHNELAELFEAAGQPDKVNKHYRLMAQALTTSAHTLNV